MFFNSTSSFPRGMNSSRLSDHKSKMSMINGPIQSEALALSKRTAEDTSPYSILRRSPKDDL
jgi:hypothetical protein